LVASTGRVEVLGQRVGRTNLQALRPRIGYLSPALAHEIPEGLTPRQIVDAAQAGALFPWYVDPERMSRPKTDAALDQAGMSRVAAGRVAAVVVVLHRLEDIAPGFTHAILVRGGRVLAAGPIDVALTDAALSTCFGMPLRAERIGERWSTRAS
jgi:ABC-type molybdenum transport system ATPase subunit/photorepair protein PhrA